MNSEDDRSRIVRFGLREVTLVVLDLVDDNNSLVVRDAAAAADGACRSGGTNASTDEGPEHHTVEELPARATTTSRAEIVNFAMV